MTGEQFVRELGAENEALLARLAPDDTLKPEVDGALNVPNLLKVALRNEVEATEIAARWLVATDDVRVKMAFARQAGDEAKHFRMIADRLRQLGFDPEAIDPLAGGFGPREPVECVGDRQQPPGRAAVRLAPRQAAELGGGKVLADGEGGHGGGPPPTTPPRPRRRRNPQV